MAERLFGTDGLRGTVNNYPMTVDVALRLGLAAGVRFDFGGGNVILLAGFANAGLLSDDLAFI